MREMGGPQRRWLRAGFIWHSLTKLELVGMDRAQAPRFGLGPLFQARCRHLLLRSNNVRQ
uniref:Uncharacterized protein n=1 Tax=Oryza glumipatula TaxID=40148 RepID=A0A0E0AZN7_9ORYZ